MEEVSMAQKALQTLAYLFESLFNPAPGTAAALIVVAIVLFVYIRLWSKRRLDADECECSSCSSAGEALVLVLVAESLHAAARRGCLKQVRDILKKCDVVVDTRDSDGFTPFALACINSHIGVMRSLLEAGADPRQVFQLEEPFRARWSISYHFPGDRRWPEDREATAAHAACLSANKEMLELMLHHGASANDVFKESTLLSVAANANCTEAKDVVRLLLDQGADVNAVDISGDSVLWRAACDIEMDLARMLLEAGADVNAIGERSELSPLIFGSRDLAMAVLLLQFGADVNDDSWLGTPLMSVSLFGGADQQERARLLLQHGAEVEATSDEGSTAFDRAAEREHPGVMQELLEYQLEVLPEYDE